MAEWKKIIVSGSDISQLNNDAGYLTSITAQNAFTTASFNGTDLLADSSQGQLNFTSGSGGQAGILITATAGTDTLDFSLGTASVPNAALTNDGITFGSADVSLGDTVTQLSLTGFTGSLSATSVLANGVTATTQTIGDNSTKVATTAYVDAVATAADLDLVGDGSTATAVDLDSQTLTFTGQDGLQLSASAQTITATIADDSITNAKLDNNSITIGNESVALGGTLTTISGLTASGSFSGSFEGDGSGLTGTGGASIISGDAADNQVAVFNSGNTIEGDTNFTWDGSTLAVTGAGTFSSDLTVGGDLIVTGDTINANVTNLDIEDRYILLNSGSATIGDSGIVFGGANGVAQSGAGLVWDASYNSNDGRLAIVNDMASNATGDQTTSYHVAGVFEGTEANAATAQADHVGNIRVEGTDIFIYV